MTNEAMPDLFGAQEWRIIADDVAPVDITEILAATNARRIVYGFVWYYNASGDAATRVLTASVRKPGRTRPTGYGTSTTTRVWVSASVTLTVNEEGLIYAVNTGGRDGLTVYNDNGTVTVDDHTTAPSPFPLRVSQNDLVEIFFDITDGHANDRHTIMVLQEEWIEE